MNHHNQRPGRHPQSSGYESEQPQDHAYGQSVLGRMAALEAQVAALHDEGAEQQRLHEAAVTRYLEETPDGEVVMGHAAKYEELFYRANMAAGGTSLEMPARMKDVMELYMGGKHAEADRLAKEQEDDFSIWIHENGLRGLAEAGYSDYSQENLEDHARFEEGVMRAKGDLLRAVDTLAHRDAFRLGKPVTVQRSGKDGQPGYYESGWTIDAIGATGRITLTNGTLSKRVSVGTLEKWNPQPLRASHE